MEKFRVGDKVRFVKSTIFHTNDVKIGETYKIIKIAGSGVRYQVENEEWFKEEELVNVEYTYEDLKKAPIGTKITFENGEEMIKCSAKRYENGNKWRAEKDFARMEDKIGILGKITKIEEPVYNTVYEDKQNILTETEKNYLKIVIGPVKDKVLNITKTQPITYTARKFIDIEIQDDDCICLSFIDENSELSYKGMKTEHPYTLQELGL